MKIFLTAIALCLSFFSQATIFYISPTGNDVTGNGTAGNPWKTLYKATNAVSVPGDIIHVNAGTYIETLQAALKPGVSIEGDGITSILKSTLTADFTPMLILQSAEGTNGNQYIANLKFDGQNLTTAWGIDVAGRSNVSIHDITMVDFRDRGVIFTGKSDFSDGPPTIYATGNTFYNNTVINCAQYLNGYGRGCLNIGGQDGLLVHHNTLVQDSRPSGQNGWPLKLAGTGYIKGVKIYNNTLIKNKFLGNYPGDQDWDFAVELWYSQGGCELYNNTITGGVDLAENYKTGAYTYSWYVHDNTISQPTLNDKFQGGIYFERQIEGAIVENNTFDKVTSGVILNIEDFGAGPYQAINNVKIRKNLFTNIGKAAGNGNNGSGIWIYCDATATFDINGLNIDNNTIVAAPGNAPFEGLNFNYGNAAGTTKNVNIRNNIVQGFYDYWLRVGNAASTIDSFTVQNNNSYLNAGANAASFPYGTPPYYINSGNISVNPLFISILNFQLQLLSPVIDKGVDVGLPYNNLGPDLGYFETGSLLPNNPPTAIAGPDQTITLPTNSVSLSGSGTDTDGTISSYLWTKISGPAATITNPSAAATTVTGMLQGTYKFELTVTDNSGATGKDTMQVIVNAANIAPTANAGPDQTITLPTNSVSLSGSGTDPDGTISSYSWTKITGPAATITNANATATTVTGMVQGTYKFELKVTDNGGAVGRDTIQVFVNAAGNIAPTANAGPDQTITLPTNSVSLSGSGNDPDGTISSYSWIKITGPAANITNANAAATTVTGMVQGTYKFELTVTDNSGATGKDTMQVTVNAAGNIAPIANAGPDQSINLPTNSVSLSGSGTDPDGTISSYSWVKISGPAATITNANAAATTVTALIQGTYKFELTVSDNSGATGKDTMQVIVNAAGNIAPVANAGPDQSITLPTNVVILSGSGIDPDGTISSYSWAKISGPTATITNANAASTPVTGLVLGTYKFELTVTDNNGATGKDTMQVIVTPAANIAPTANAGPDQTIILPTNSVSLSGSGTDPDGTISSYSWIKIAGPAATIANANAAATTVTGMIQGTYKFELTVTDNSGATGKDTMQVIVNAAANMAPTANAGPDQTIILPTNIVILSGSGTDPDGTISSYSWTKIAGPTATITNANAASTPVTGLVLGTYLFELKVTDNGGAFDRDTVQIIVNPAPNLAPTANAGPDQSITFPTTSVILNGSGTDLDGTIAGYLWTKISGPATGTIANSTAAGTSVTGLGGGIYKFELRVTDNNGAVGRDTMQVIVFVPNIPPVANAGLNQSITLPTSTANLIGSGSDVDGAIIAYNWTKISGPSAGTIVNANAAATTVTGLAAGIYKFELRVTDNNNATARDTMQVTVNPANVPPVANAGPDQSVVLPSNKVTLTGSGTDVDGIVVSYAWKQISGPADKLTSINTPVTVLDNLIVGAYKLELTVTDNKGATGKDTVNVTVAEAIIPSQNSVTLYPNPVIDITTLDIKNTNANGTVLIQVTDLQGKIVYKKQLSAGNYATKEKINMSTFSKGVYLVTVYFTSQDKQTIKAMKQ